MTDRSLTLNNLASLSWKTGYRGVSGLARAINRNRVTVYAAIRNPQRYAPTYRLIARALAANETPRLGCAVGADHVRRTKRR